MDNEETRNSVSSPSGKRHKSSDEESCPPLIEPNSPLKINGMNDEKREKASSAYINDDANVDVANGELNTQSDNALKSNYALQSIESNVESTERKGPFSLDANMTESQNVSNNEFHNTNNIQEMETNSAIAEVASPTIQDAGAGDATNSTATGSSRFRNRRVGTRTRNYRTRTQSVSSHSSNEGFENEFLTELGERNPSSSPDSGEAFENEMDADLTMSTSDSEIFFGRDTHSESDSERDQEVETENADEADSLQEVLNKPKPKYTWNSTHEIMFREHGLSCDNRFMPHGNMGGFISRFYSSRHIIERMKLLHRLSKHAGCVNCLNFNRSGNMLCTGSDDLKVIIWDWAQNKPKLGYKSGHTENIFQAKFSELNGCLDVITTSRDGQVRRGAIPPPGGKITTSLLYKHSGAVHKLVLCPQNPFEVLSAGEDGNIMRCDMRKEPADKLKSVKVNKRKVRLFSIAHHPFDPEICVCGSDNYVRVYDKRNMNKTVHEMCPQELVDQTIPHITCSVYNSTGSEILSSYSDSDIYLFNNKVYIPGHYSHRYRGHYNHKTIKGVNFFGPNSEYVISGSDCGNIFFWDKYTESIITFMEGDTSGIVNCLEPHPTIPILATSGLDHNVKIWSPNSETYPPDLSNLEKCVKRNLKRSVVDEANAFDDRQFYFFIRQFLRRSQSRNESNDSNSNVPDIQGASSSEEDDLSMAEGQFRGSRQLHCNPQ